MAQIIRCAEVNFDNLSLYKNTIKYNNKPVYFQCLVNMQPFQILCSNGYSTLIQNDRNFNIELYNFILKFDNKYRLDIDKDLIYKSSRIMYEWDNTITQFYFGGTEWVNPNVKNKAILIINNGICKQTHIINDDKLLFNNYDKRYNCMITFSIKHMIQYKNEFRSIFSIFRLEITRPPTEQEALDALKIFFRNILILPPFKTGECVFNGGILYKRAKKEFEQEKLIT
jgi:hypothetical protein